jgi:hypothetical protein
LEAEMLACGREGFRHAVVYECDHGLGFEVQELGGLDGWTVVDVDGVWSGEERGAWPGFEGTRDSGGDDRDLGA